MFSTVRSGFKTAGERPAADQRVLTLHLTQAWRATMTWYVMLVAIVNLGLGYGVCLLLTRKKQATFATDAGEHEEAWDG